MKVKNGDYSAIYLLKTTKIINNNREKKNITVQYFQRDKNIILCGIKHVLDILKKNIKNFNKLKIKTLSDGDIIQDNEPVIEITGNLEKFVFLEGIIDGILTRESSIATNAFNLLKACKNKELIYMNDRSDYYYTQEWDGYAAYIGGIRNFVTKAQTKFLNPKDIKIVGTIPHSLIQFYNGNLIKVLEEYKKNMPNDKLVALVDYNNDVINDSLKVLKKFNKEIYALRLDTSKNLIDKSLILLKNKYDINELKGINIHLVNLLRKELDKNNFKNVKIIATSGLDIKTINHLEEKNAPIDMYGVGKAFTNFFVNFTCDSVINNGRKESKIGRKYRKNDKLKIKNI